MRINVDNKYIVAVDIILIAAIAAGYLAMRTVSFQRTRDLPVFIGQGIEVEKAVKAQPVARTVVRPAIRQAAKPAVKPQPVPEAAQPLPIMPPQVIFRAMPEYPVSALEQGLEGTAVILLQVSLSGQAENISVKSSSGSLELDEAAKASVAKWRFSPATRGGQTLACRFEVPVTFRIE